MSGNVQNARWQERFAAAAGGLPGADLPWLSALRRDCFEAFAARGFPGRRDEEWRFTDPSALARTEFVPATGVSLETRGAGPGVRVWRLRAALEERPELLERWLGRLADPKTHPFVALNGALFGDGFVVEIEPGAEPTQPIELGLHHVGVAQPGDTHVRILVVAGPGSRACLVERWSGDGSYWTNAVTELVLEGDAQLDHVRLQRESQQAFHTASVIASVQGPGHFGSFSLALGGALARVDLEVRLAAEGAECELDGLYLARGSQLVDHHTWVDHALPVTRSRELYKGILDGRARGVFRGRVHVRPNAQKIEALQTNRNLLLSDEARVNTQPQLEIYADDVKCAHGASIGRLDENAIFYLRARGIDEPDARALLTLGFAREVLEHLPQESLRRESEAALEDWLAHARGGAA